MVPLLLYTCSVTHVPAKVFREFKKVTNCFLWGSGVNRVAHDTMCLSIDQGGMNLLDLETMFKATTVQWVKRFCHDDCQKWTLYLRDLVKSKGSLFYVFLEKNRKRYRQIQSPFYKKLFMIWSKMYCREVDSVLEFQNDSIWNNDYVLTRGEHFNWTHWMDAGIRQFRDILNEKGKLLTHIEIQERFGIKCDFLAIGRIKSAVPWPKFWGSDIQTEAGYQLLFPASESGPVDVLKVGSKGTYSLIQQQREKTPTAQLRWAGIYIDLPPNLAMWSEFYKTPYKACPETKLQSLQFKIYHRVVPCNKYLYQRKGIESPKCNFRDGEDDMEHFFLYCAELERFWNFIRNWLVGIVEFDLKNVSEAGLLLNNPGKAKLCCFQNYLLLNIKFYIYRQRLFHNNRLDLLEWMAELKAKLLRERYICEGEGKLRKFKDLQQLLEELG